VQEGRRVLEIEARAVQELMARLDDRFASAVNFLYECQGKVVISGMGKSGLIGQKIAATLASTGTPSFFLHPAEGVHGDLGMLARRDVLIAISNSGETQEVLQLLPFVKRMNIPVVGMTGKMGSTLAKNSDVTLDVSVDEEACPLGLAPTASTTATLAMGDALAVALLQKRGFKHDDFAQFHPGGTLGDGCW
jgi:arabinose-5-phosphate isomerase